MREFTRDEKLIPHIEYNCSMIFHQTALNISLAQRGSSRWLRSLVAAGRAIFHRRHFAVSRAITYKCYAGNAAHLVHPTMAKSGPTAHAKSKGRRASLRARVRRTRAFFSWERARSFGTVFSLADGACVRRGKPRRCSRPNDVILTSRRQISASINRSFPCAQSSIALGNSVINLRTFRGIPLAAHGRCLEVVSRERLRATPRRSRAPLFDTEYFRYTISLGEFISQLPVHCYQRYFGL